MMIVLFKITMPAASLISFKFMQVHEFVEFDQPKFMNWNMGGWNLPSEGKRCRQLQIFDTFTHFNFDPQSPAF